MFIQCLCLHFVNVNVLKMLIKMFMFVFCGVESVFLFWYVLSCLSCFV